MAQRVAGELYKSITGQLFEIGRQLRQPNGYPFDPQELKLNLQAVIEGRFGGIPVFSQDMRKKGWTLVKDVAAAGEISIANLELISFLKKGENLVSGEEMCKRAGELDANLGQHHTEYLLEHQKEIPIEWRKFYLIFAGTVWRDRLGDLCVPCLYWYGERWCLDFRWFGSGWDFVARLLRLRK